MPRPPIQHVHAWRASKREARRTARAEAEQATPAGNRVYPAPAPSERITKAERRERRQAAAERKAAGEAERERKREAARADPKAIARARQAEMKAAAKRARDGAEREHRQETSITTLERMMHSVIRKAIRDAKHDRPYAQVILPHQQLLTDGLIDRQEHDHAEWWLNAYSVAHGQPQRAGVMRIDNADGDAHEREGRRQVALDNLLAAENALGRDDTRRLERALGDGMSYRALGRAEGCDHKTAKTRLVDTIKRLDLWRVSAKRKRRERAEAPAAPRGR